MGHTQLLMTNIKNRLHSNQLVRQNTRPGRNFACHETLKVKFGTALSMVALSALIGLTIQPVYADISGLTPCAESKAFAKRKKQELKDLEKRLKKYGADSSPAIALKATIDRTNKRFEAYGKAGLLCGTDGLPHLIADPGYALKYGHAGDIFIPTFGFLYFAGWLGHSGRLYLESTRNKDKEIIIGVPLAAACLGKAFGWPALVIGELRSGSLLEKDSNITV